MFGIMKKEYIGILKVNGKITPNLPFQQYNDPEHVVHGSLPDLSSVEKQWFMSKGGNTHWSISWSERYTTDYQLSEGS